MESPTQARGEPLLRNSKEDVILTATFRTSRLYVLETLVSPSASFSGTNNTIRSSTLPSAAIGPVLCGLPRRNVLHLHQHARAMSRTTLAPSPTCTGSSTASKCISPTVLPMQPWRLSSRLNLPRMRLCPCYLSRWPWEAVCQPRRGGERDESRL